MKDRTGLAVLTFLIVLPLSTLNAQDPLTPDRPGLGNGSHVLNPKITYLESGVEYFDLGATDQFSIGQVLFRHGLTFGVELRVQLNSLVLRNTPFANQSGIPDPGVGLKLNIMDKPGSVFRLSGLGSITVPTGSSSFTSDEWVPSFALLADYGLSEQWGLSSNLGYTFGPGSLEGIWMFTVTPGYSFPDEAGLGIYFGYAGFYSDLTEEHFLEAGATKQISSNLQVDLNGGWDVDSGNLFIGAGLALRF